MKKFIRFVLETIIICTMMITVTFYGIVGYPEDVFATSYQSTIQDKFKTLKETNDPKIIIVGGSNAAFGMDQGMLEDATGYKVVNLGLHAGFNQIFHSELSKANINRGDIVLLAYEYNWCDEEQFESIGTELVMSGIDSNIELYKYIPAKAWSSILGYLGTYAYKKNTFEPVGGQYSREAFDEATGQMIFSRNYNMSDYRSNIGLYGTLDLLNVTISDATIKYLKEYRELVERKGARVYFVAPPLLREAVVSGVESVENIKKLEEEVIGIPYISNPVDYLYPETLMSNSIYHCNDRGEKERTRQLICDLYTAGVTDIKNIGEYQQTKDNEILFEYDLEKYIEDINNPCYTIFMSVKDEGTNALTEGIKAGLSEMGLKIDLTGKYRNSYYAVISSNGIIEDIGDAKLEASGVITDTGAQYLIASAGFDCGNYSSIIIDGVEYARNIRGLNIVVYNNETGQVVDSVCFDTFGDLSADR